MNEKFKTDLQEWMDGLPAPITVREHRRQLTIARLQGYLSGLRLFTSVVNGVEVLGSHGSFYSVVREKILKAAGFTLDDFPEEKENDARRLRENMPTPQNSGRSGERGTGDGGDPKSSVDGLSVPDKEVETDKTPSGGGVQSLAGTTDLPAA